MNADTIVVVEDNAINMRLMADILRVAGFTMIGLTDGEGVCDTVAEAAPLVVLMDIRLPRWSGIELRRFLADDPRTHHVPVIAVTASCDELALLSYEQENFLHVIQKPLKVRVVLELLTSLRSQAGG